MEDSGRTCKLFTEEIILNNYYARISVYKSQNKIKVNYGIIPVRKIVTDNEEFYKSDNNGQEYRNFKKYKNNLIKFSKEKEVVLFEMIYSSEDEFIKAEKNVLLIANKIIKSKIPFRFKFKKKLKERVKFLLNQ